ncbi:ABC transporter permease [Marisediminicola antarctica]|uniref:ABC transporter permease n=1 Tax=Marisediminicola antarctica TaxID=674079 RepID=A0A7L5AMX8_9MICO|nr:ABC transporter permease subunit [Marisediminicola antarctica]QHO70694.1 ABC transporter permease [Marisediminicola antarctica]
MTGLARRIGLGALAIVLLGVIWELYKAVGPAEGVDVAGLQLLPRTTDLAMPHIWDMIARALEPVNSSEGSPPVWTSVLLAGLSSLGTASVGLLIGSIVGFGLALLMQRFRVAESAVLPWLVLSQTVPLIALAPLIVSWGGRVQIGTFEWERWMSVAVIAAYLAFFPVAVGALRGLQSPDEINVELFHAYATGWWATLIHLRLPASVPYLLPALRLGAASAIIGTVVAEVSTGAKGGIGRLIIEYAQSGSSDPAKAYSPIAVAVIMGLAAAAIVALAGATLKRYRRNEVTA